MLCNPWSSFSGVLTVALISARYEEVKDNSSPKEKPPFHAHINCKGVSILFSTITPLLAKKNHNPGRTKYPSLAQRETVHQLLKLSMLSTQTSWKCDHFRKKKIKLIFLEIFKAVWCLDLYIKYLWPRSGHLWGLTLQALVPLSSPHHC